MSNKSAPWANLDAEELGQLREDLARRLHKRWLKATRKVLEDHTMCAATDALLVVANSFVLTTLQNIPTGARKDRLHALHRELEQIPTPLEAPPDDMPAETYFDRPYSGFWCISEQSRLAALLAGHPNEAHADECAFDVQLEATLAHQYPYETDHIDFLNPERVKARRRSLDPDP